MTRTASASEILAAMRDYGADVKTYRGWDSFGAWNSSCEGMLIHHTATASASVDNPVPSLGWLVSAYDKPCANMLVGKVEGTTYLCAAGPSYHCGYGGPWSHAGIPEGNRPDMLFGIEIDDPGVSTKSLTDYQIDNTAKIAAGLWDVFDWPSEDRIGTHKCWTDLCHIPSKGPGAYLGRKNDTIDGEWGQYPGSPNPAPYNAPFWRERIKALRSKPAAWDGTVPTRAAATKAFNEDLRNRAAWRLACRLHDMGFMDSAPLAEGKQPYPTRAVQKARQAFGWTSGDGSPSERLWKRVFGRDK